MRGKLSCLSVLILPLLLASGAARSAQFDPNLIGWWNFEEGQGALAIDSSGANNHGTLIGDPQWVQGYDGLALDLDGDGDYIEIGKVASELGVGGNAPRTIALWVYPRSFNGGGLYEVGGDGLREDFSLRTRAIDHWQARYGGIDANVPGDSPNEWVHLTHTYEASRANVYVNSFYPDHRQLVLRTSDERPLRIGTCAGITFDGLIDDVRLYDRAVTWKEIQRIMYGSPFLSSDPQPKDGALTDIVRASVLRWDAGAFAVAHDVYLGTDETEVSEATIVTEGIYRGRYIGDATSYVVSEQPLPWNATYYWRVDEIDPNGTITRGKVWTFQTADYLIIDDFESYDYDETRIYETWIDGYGTDNGSIVGYLETPYAAGPIIAHTGRQSMPFTYDNTEFAWNSEAYRLWDDPQNWMPLDVDTLTLHLIGIPISFLKRDDGSILMGGSGSYRWETEDSFRFACKQLHGDGSIIVRVDSLANTGPWDRAGVMIRESFDDDGRHATVLVTTGHGVSFQHRFVDEGVAERRTCEGPKAPYWVKLDRSGDTFTAWRSPDGVRWVHATGDPSDSSVNILMASDVYMGLAVSSDLWPATSAEFSGVSTTGDVTGPWEVAKVGSQWAGNEPETLYVGLSDEAGNHKVVNHPDPLIVGAALWERWDIPLSEFSAAGVDVTGITKMILGFGDRDNPAPGGAGMMHFDDFRLTRSAASPPDETP